MIAVRMEEGAGLANQIWKYSVARAIAKHNGYNFTVLDPHKFKGQHFIDIDYGLDPNGLQFPVYNEKVTINEFGKDVSSIDYDMYNVPDGTEIRGTMQSLRYFDGISKDEISSWIQIRNPCWKLTRQICHIQVRGGDFLGTGPTLLPRKYFLDAMEFVRENFNPTISFVIITDHREYARWLLPEIPIMEEPIFGEPDIQDDPYQAPHHIGKNIPSAFKILAASSCNIISNSSFGWWSTYLNPHNPFVVAPAYWAGFGYDENFWSTAQIQVPVWNYIDKRGNLL